jgi:hypothetical protein
MARALRRLGLAGGVGSVLWMADDRLNDGTFIRNFRTIYVAARTAVEYKMMHADNIDGVLDAIIRAKWAFWITGVNYHRNYATLIGAMPQPPQRRTSM